uniref:Uncharacterized protein n=1 Tax=Myoviridae sp. ctLnO19 TaxID=2825085 RepID=A0A8S5P264_9CAUD|nr:MAG TPA: hypothetical protein [Myoviridae sp. ctLnO19]DAJ68999.1 MAG TPA: hypothetical protein [Caudoviricetes sp.]
MAKRSSCVLVIFSYFSVVDTKNNLLDCLKGKEISLLFHFSNI